MKCPFCGHLEDKVIDSRAAGTGEVIRRRRECEACSRRFTTYERVEELSPLIIKKDGRRETFDREKILAGLKKACEKRPIPMDELESTVTEIERKLQGMGEKEVASSFLGEEVMGRLQKLDEVAYVRFASVYRSFRDISEFMNELKELIDGQGKQKDAKLQTREER